MQPETILALTASGMGIIGVSSLTGLVIGIKSWGKREQSRADRDTQIEKRLASIECTLVGNGKPGLVNDFHKLEISCAGEMASLVARVDSLEQRTDEQTR